MSDHALAEKIQALLAQGEGPALEYKSSLRWDYGTSQVNKELTKVVVRTLAAFLNSHGGSLLIGVADDGTILDLELDLSTLSKKSLDGFELTLRTAIATHLGTEIDPHISVVFCKIDNKHVALAECSPHPSPVYYQDGDRRTLFVRSGNLTRNLDVAAAVAYIASHWTSTTGITESQMRSAIAEALAEQFPRTPPQPTARAEQIPIWLTLATSRVLNMFLGSLSQAPGWKRINIISPWIDEVSGPLVTLTFDQLLRRLKDDRTTLYVVTRPPQEYWHSRAIDRLAATGRANIALLPDLHVKLFTAQTSQTSFAMLGSANFTTRSLVNREIGILLTSTGDGKPLVQDLHYEAAEIYRHPARKLVTKAQL